MKLLTNISEENLNTCLALLLDRQDGIHAIAEVRSAREAIDITVTHAWAMVPIPILVEALMEAFNATRDSELLPWPRMEECPTREILEEAAARVLRIDGRRVAGWRDRIAREPTASGRLASRPRLSAFFNWRTQWFGGGMQRSNPAHSATIRHHAILVRRWPRNASVALSRQTHSFLTGRCSAR